MTPKQLEALKALLAKANIKGLPRQEMETAGREAVFALLNAAPALIAAAEREAKLRETAEWIITDAAYKAPEQIGYVAARWLYRLNEAIHEALAENAE